MDRILYIDLFFLWNFWMNVLVLFIVRQITRTYRTLQCLTAAAAGALVTCLGLFWYIQQENTAGIFFLQTGALVFMNLLAFGSKNLVWHMFLSMISITVLAGISFYLVLFWGVKTDSIAGIMVSFIAVIFCILLEKQSRVRWKEEHMKVKTVLEFEDRTILATALMDTGNKLYDPFYHKPVILINEKMIKEIIDYCREYHPEKLRFIPFHSVGRDNGILEGIMFDYVSIKWQNKKMKFREVICAATKENLYKGKEYQVIFHCGLLQEG